MSKKKTMAKGVRYYRFRKGSKFSKFTAVIEADYIYLDSGCAINHWKLRFIYRSFVFVFQTRCFSLVILYHSPALDVLSYDWNFVEQKINMDNDTFKFFHGNGITS